MAALRKQRVYFYFRYFGGAEVCSRLVIMALLLSAGIGLIGLAVYWRTKCWSHPAVIFCLFWCLVAAVPIIAVPQAHASAGAMLFLLAASACFAAPAFVGNWQRAARPASEPTPLASSWLVWLALVIQIAPVGLAALNIERQGFSVLEAITQPIETACRYLAARYGGEISPTVFSQLGTVLNYIGAPLSGIVLATQRSWRVRAVVFVVAFLPSLVAVLVYADKGTMFLAAAYMIGGTLVGRVSRGNTALVTRDMVLGVVAGAVIIAPVMALALLNRGGGECADGSRTAGILTTLTQTLTGDTPAIEASIGKTELDRAAGLGFYIRTYAFSHIFAFSDWFDSHTQGAGSMAYREESGPTWGFWTFLAIGERLAPGRPVPEGYFDEYFEEPGVLRSNIYTMYRGLIYDFTTPGALLFMGLAGALASAAYRHMLRAGLAPLSQTIYIATAGFAYSSYLLSIWTWASVFAAMAGVFMVLWAARHQPLKVLRPKLA